MDIKTDNIMVVDQSKSSIVLTQFKRYECAPLAPLPNFISDSP